MMFDEDDLDFVIPDLSSSPFFDDPFFLVDEWTKAQDKVFETALAVYGEDTPDRWEKIAKELPGKTPQQVEEHYRLLVEDVENIESGRVPIPEYQNENRVEVKVVDEKEKEKVNDFNDVKEKGLSVEAELLAEEEEFKRRGKGVSWTEHEHRLFLLGLKKYGKGDWKSISRHYVVTKSPVQVASHAQKFFRRVNTSKKKRRQSIHDIQSVTPEQAHSINLSLRSNSGPSPSRRRSYFSPMTSMAQASNVPPPPIANSSPSSFRLTSYVPPMTSMAQTSNVPPPISGGPSLIPSKQLPLNGYCNFGGHPSENLSNGMEAYPPNSTSGQVLNSTNTLWDAASGLSGLSSNGNYMHPGQWKMQ